MQKYRLLLKVERHFNLAHSDSSIKRVPGENDRRDAPQTKWLEKTISSGITEEIEVVELKHPSPDLSLPKKVSKINENSTQSLL